VSRQRVSFTKPKTRTSHGQFEKSLAIIGRYRGPLDSQSRVLLRSPAPRRDNFPIRLHCNAFRSFIASQIGSYPAVATEAGIEVAIREVPGKEKVITLTGSARSGHHNFPVGLKGHGASGLIAIEIVSQFAIAAKGAIQRAIRQVTG
jgi:hypothetical protein